MNSTRFYKIWFKNYERQNYLCIANIQDLITKDQQKFLVNDYCLPYWNHLPGFRWNCKNKLSNVWVLLSFINHWQKDFCTMSVSSFFFKYHDFLPFFQVSHLYASFRFVLPLLLQNIFSMFLLNIIIIIKYISYACS